MMTRFGKEDSKNKKKKPHTGSSKALKSTDGRILIILRISTFVSLKSLHLLENVVTLSSV